MKLSLDLPRREANPERNPHDVYPMTPETIAAAQLAQLRERAAVYERTGIRIDADGSIERPPQEPSFASIGLALGNFMSAAIYGPKGEWR